MGHARQEHQEEQQRVNQVIRAIDRQIAADHSQAARSKKEMMKIRRNFWEDVRVNIDDPGEAAETAISIKQQAEVLSDRERRHRQAQNQLMTLERLKESPWFGRVDFKEEGDPEIERIYIGISSFLNPEDENFLVYDWRAPISSLYYDYPPGSARYETPAGTISGTMKLKRQYLIRNGQIQSLFDTGVTIGDELLQEVLGNRTDAQMKSIVATIQKEQNRIIRNEGPRLLVVQGAAGSGKTSAALQRVAYLLYRHRETLRAEQILLFSPNPMFNSYVSTVLPELGEENMQQTTFQDLLQTRLGDVFRLEDSFTQMEYTLTALDEAGYTPRMEGIRWKASLDFMHLLDQYLVMLGRKSMIFKDVSFRGEILISSRRITERFYALDPSLPIPNRIQLLVNGLLTELKRKERLERGKPWVEEEVQLLDPDTYHEVHQKLQREKRFTEETFDDFHREQELLVTWVLQQHFKPLYNHIKQLRFIDLPRIYRRLFTEPGLIFHLHAGDHPPPHLQTICAQTVERLDRNELPYEDAAPYLYLKEQIEGLQRNTDIRHLFIDEAQDWSPFQFAFVKKLFSRSKMTVLGDTNQAIHANTADTTGLESLSALYGEEEREAFTLTRSYRSTRPIVEFTRRLLPGGEKIEPFNRPGGIPTLTEAADAEELIAKVVDGIRELQGAGHQTIAVICKTAGESRRVWEELRQVLPIRLIEKETPSFEAGTLVIPSYLAKGVEFDAVVIFDTSQYGRESERKLFYTACTRAMHELHLYTTGKGSPFLSKISPDILHRADR